MTRAARKHDKLAATGLALGVLAAGLPYAVGAGSDPSAMVTPTPDVAETQTFVYDARGQLRQAHGPAGTERYLFGPDAERIAAIGPDGMRLWFGDSETRFTAAGVPVERVHHVAAGEPVARIASGGAAELQYADAHQNLVLSLHRDGAVMAAFVYGAFGEVVGDHDVGAHRRRFNGKEHDELTGLRHYGYRSYDPVLLRWGSADPKYRFAPDAAWAEPQRANLYAFSLNNALRYVDPDGRDPDEPDAIDVAFDAGARASRALTSIPDGVARGFETVEQRAVDQTNEVVGRAARTVRAGANAVAVELFARAVRAKVEARVSEKEQRAVDEIASLAGELGEVMVGVLGAEDDESRETAPEPTDRTDRADRRERRHGCSERRAEGCSAPTTERRPPRHRPLEYRPPRRPKR